MSRADAVAPFLAMQMAAKAGAAAAAGRSIVRFDVGQPVGGAPEGALRRLAELLAHDPLGYTDALGSGPLRAAIARRYETHYRVPLDPRRVVITTGASGGFILAFLAALPDRGRVALAAPGYPPYRHILTALGFEPVVCEAQTATGMQLTPDPITAAHHGNPLAAALVASPANPTGTMLDRAALTALAARCRQLGIWLISDEIYHGLSYGQTAVSALEVDPDAIVINSFSKFWAMTGWRVGFMVVPERLVEAAERLAQNLFICPPAVSQAAALAALSEDASLSARVELYRANRAKVLGALPGLGLSLVAPADGAFYALLDITAHSRDSLSWCDAMLNQAGVALTPGVDFCRDRGGGWVRLAYARSADEVDEGLDRLAKALT